jgi:hypothetical protein
MGAYVLLSLAIGTCAPQLRAGWTIAVLADTAFLAAWYWALLRLVGRPARYVQTASAIFALQIVLAAPGIVELSLSQWRLTDPTARSSSLVAGLDVVLMLTITGWTLIATSYIVRAALERTVMLSWILAFAQMVAEGILLSATY